MIQMTINTHGEVLEEHGEALEEVMDLQEEIQEEIKEDEWSLFQILVLITHNGQCRPYQGASIVEVRDEYHTKAMSIRPVPTPVVVPVLGVGSREVVIY